MIFFCFVKVEAGNILVAIAFLNELFARVGERIAQQVFLILIRVEYSISIL